MRVSPARLFPAFPVAGAGTALLPAPIMAAAPGTLGVLLPTVIANFAFAVAVVLLFIFGLYAYASLARFAPYHSWIYLYLVSLSGIAWATFLLEFGGSLSDTVFLLTTVIGINLIVHVLRYDRIVIPSPLAGKSPGISPG